PVHLPVPSDQLAPKHSHGRSIGQAPPTAKLVLVRRSAGELGLPRLRRLHYIGRRARRPEESSAMMSAFRGFYKSWPAKVLFALLALSFVIWGASSRSMFNVNL